MFEDVVINHIIERQNVIGLIDSNGNEYKMYRRFIEYFSGINGQLKEKHLIDGACLSYAWMPTILNFKSELFTESLAILNQARGNDLINRAQLDILKGLINNSVVGPSKLIHFINPDKYAIWDSRVCKCLTGKGGKVNSVAAYFDYLAMCQRITTDSKFDRIHILYKKKVNYNISRMRSIEQIFFLSVNNPIVNN